MAGAHVQGTCTEELAWLIARVAGLGAVTAEALARERGWTLAAARSRLSQAERRGLLAAWRPLREQASLYTATAAGLRAAGVSGIAPARVSPAGARHSVVCSLAAAELCHGYPGHRVVGEAELRREERSGGRLLASVTMGGPAAAVHRPDLALLRDGADATAIAVEVELTVKAPRRLEAICLAWSRARHLEGVLYLAPEGVRPALGRAIERSRAAGRVAVVAIESLDSTGAGAIERAITGDA